MSMGRRRRKSGAEQDATTPWRHLLCYMQRAGVRAGIKRQMRRRERKEAKQRIKDGQE